MTHIEETKVQQHEDVASPKQRLSRPRVRWTDALGSHDVRIVERVLVGSAPGAGIVVTEPTVSRLHAELEPREDGLWVRDLGSRNGTRVEGVKVTAGLVPDKGTVHLGAAELVVQYEGHQADPVEAWAEDHFGPLHGTSVAMRTLFARLARIAPTDSPVLIQGETGTGKELVAQALHEASQRASKPFVIVDCAALPENLIESELFGHAQGAFTGATRARVGAIESADGGTVFLDEIGELVLALQPRLLRVLETRTIRRIGETARRSVDVRFISATNRDLRTMVNVGGFREDLFFRLAVLPIVVPPLRERLEDIPLLVHRFLPPDVAPDPNVLRHLARKPWLGNVRELRNFVDRAIAVGAREALRSDDPPPSTSSAVAGATEPDSSALPEISFSGDLRVFREKWIEAGEREYITKLLARHDRSVADAAREANVTRTYIYRLLRKHLL